MKPQRKQREAAMRDKTFTVQDVLLAQCTLEPLHCFHCEVPEVTFHPYVGDAFCAACGRWQMEYSNPASE